MLPAVLRDEPQFRLLFAGQLLSLVGDRIASVAWPFATLGVGGGAADVALVTAAQFAPFAVLALVAGVVADRRDRRALMIASDAVRLVAQAAGAVLLLSGAAEVWSLAALAVAYGAADALFQPAMVGLLPQTVSAARLQDANALRGLTFSAGSLAGPVLAGVLIAAGGPGAAFVADAATFAVSIACLTALRPRVVERAAAVAGSFAADLRGGWRAVRERAWVQAGLSALLGYHVVVLPAIFVLGPVLMDEDYGGAGDWALITACFGAGAI
ncbi:MAG TPA: MFS transporter, partial [Baekduia sp.]|nr:MFS transporter [Baekduia sp.]